MAQTEQARGQSNATEEQKKEANARESQQNDAGKVGVVIVISGNWILETERITGRTKCSGCVSRKVDVSMYLHIHTSTYVCCTSM